MKRLVFILAFIFFLFLFPKSTAASIILIDKNGEIIWKVLALESTVALADPTQNLEITRLANQEVEDKEIFLNRVEGKVSLKVGETKELDVTNLGEDLIEIEERGATKKIEIGLLNDKFAITEGGIVAVTLFPININPVENRLSVVTSTGEKFLNVLPFEAGQVALRSKYLTKISQNVFDITEENKDISYLISGSRVINIFNLVKVNIPVSTKISASTGEIISVEQPTWLKILGFVFS